MGVNEYKMSEHCAKDANEKLVIDDEPGVPRRESWNSKLDFFLATLGYIVGFGNFWRFPYLCYRSGGASFLFPYFLMLFVIGIPMFFMELSVGQWYEAGMVSVWKAVCPLASGLGYGTLLMQLLSNIYYIVILAWVLFYLFDSFRSHVPWESCGNWWNTPFCRTQRTASQTVNCSAFALPVNCSQTFTSPSEEYWTNRVLQITDSLEDMGEIRWELVGTLILSWVLVYFCIFKSVRLTGKVWVYAATQIYWSLGIGFGGIITFGSFNSFKNNVNRDAVTIACANCATSFVAGFAVFSILGFMAFVLKTTVDKVAASGPGLVFIAYPEAISQLPGSVFWAILFFTMLVTLGLDTMFGAIEALATGIIDEYPAKLRAKKWLVLLGLCVALGLLGLSCITQGGMYVFNLFDYQAAGLSLLFMVLLENVYIAWIYGMDRFSNDIEVMTGQKPYIWVTLCLKYITPACSSAIILANMINWTGIKYDGRPYPGWAEAVGWVMCISPMVIPVAVAVYVVWRTPGTLRERWRIVTTPDQTTLVRIEKKHGIHRRRGNMVVNL
ncbi:sodium- and chloride-dependent GABA transporter 1 isoform X2 [Nematostella vectensis]|uniref:sodium- and chloride-dependent GABA transporter 1 isoform X2 n=1 Tax=Nematostella vectensis TaxID=45351 RepID=UPI002077734C|nr:sodium- and chloride-dependent GABA transporter 1 isoform X2 [Nematostella vectensis]